MLLAAEPVALSDSPVRLHCIPIIVYRHRAFTCWPGWFARCRHSGGAKCGRNPRRHDAHSLANGRLLPQSAPAPPALTTCLCRSLLIPPCWPLQSSSVLFLVIENESLFIVEAIPEPLVVGPAGRPAAGFQQRQQPATSNPSDPPEMGRQTNQSKLVCTNSLIVEVPAEPSKQASEQQASQFVWLQRADQRRRGKPTDWILPLLPPLGTQPLSGSPIRRAQFSHCFAIALALTSASHQF